MTDMNDGKDTAALNKKKMPLKITNKAKIMLSVFGIGVILMAVGVILWLLGKDQSFGLPVAPIPLLGAFMILIGSAGFESVIATYEARRKAGLDTGDDES